jgi:hypothetical protein
MQHCTADEAKLLVDFEDLESTKQLLAYKIIYLGEEATLSLLLSKKSHLIIRQCFWRELRPPLGPRKGGGGGNLFNICLDHHSKYTAKLSIPPIVFIPMQDQLQFAWTVFIQKKIIFDRTSSLRAG